jgi:hypothetical protein
MDRKIWIAAGIAVAVVVLCIVIFMSASMKHGCSLVACIGGLSINLSAFEPAIVPSKICLEVDGEGKKMFIGCDASLVPADATPLCFRDIGFIESNRSYQAESGELKPKDGKSVYSTDCANPEAQQVERMVDISNSSRFDTVVLEGYNPSQVKVTARWAGKEATWEFNPNYETSRCEPECRSADITLPAP